MRGTQIGGFTLTRGNATEGAGIRLFESSATLSNLIISDNNSVYGGGIYIRSGTPNLNNIMLMNNHAQQNGGGMVVFNNSSPTIQVITATNNTIGGCCGVGMAINDSGGLMEYALLENNQSQTGNTLGGGAYLAGSTITIRNAVVRNNRSNFGGGFYLAQQAAVTIEDTEIANNIVTNEGGGLTITGNVSQVNTSQLKNVTIQNNSAEFGGGVYVQFGATPQMPNTVIQTNTATYGGGMFFERAAPALEKLVVRGNSATAIGGGLFLEHAASITLTKSLIHHNSAGGWGGGISVSRNSASPFIANNFIFNNTAPEGAGIAHETWRTGQVDPGDGPAQPRQVPTKIYHNTIVNNSTDGIQCRVPVGEMPNDLIMTNLILWDNGGADIATCTPNATYSNIEDGNPGAGNISLAPSFVDQASGDLHLDSGSSSIDAGTDIGLIDDIDAQLRDNLPDMGADEALTDLVITKTGMKIGTDVTFVINFHNAGSVLATGVRITDSIPAELTNLNVQSSGAALSQVGTLPVYIWTAADLALGQGGTITITGTYSGQNNLVNTVQIGGEKQEANLLDNTATATAASPLFLPVILK